MGGASAVPERNALEACKVFQLNLPSIRGRGLPGGHVGTAAGSSVEFLDFRDYLPGDDLRHVDWSVYGRTGDMVVRLWREETQPELDVLLDVSRSMGLPDGMKGEVASDISRFIVHGARLLGVRSRLHLVDTSMASASVSSKIEYHGSDSLLFDAPQRCTETLVTGGVRWLVTDFMSGKPPAACIRELARSAAQLVVIMVLGPWEAMPERSHAATLVDSETGERLPLHLSTAACARYQRRLSALYNDVQLACLSVGAPHVRVVADQPLLQVLGRDLLPARMVRPA